MSFIQFLKESIPYRWKREILDVIRPNRSGMGPILRDMDRDIATTFDIGANIGYVSLCMLYYFPKATVYSFEPCFETHGKL